MRSSAILSPMILVLSLGSAQAASEVEAGDPVLGQKQFGQCMACHNVTANGPNKVGPNLYGILGRKAGSKSDFAYSDALKNAGFEWDENKLNQYIRKPSEMLPGNKMAFIGIAKDEVRANIIAYLKEAAK